MKTAFEKTADPTKTLKNHLKRGHYKAAAKMIAHMSTKQRPDFLYEFSRGNGGLFVKQKDGYFHGTSFLDHLMDHKNDIQIIELIKTAPDIFDFYNHGGLAIVHNHKNGPEMIGDLLKADPTLERHFYEEMSFQTFMVQSQYLAHKASGKPDVELHFHDVTLPQRDIKALCF